MKGGVGSGEKQVRFNLHDLCYVSSSANTVVFNLVLSSLILYQTASSLIHQRTVQRRSLSICSRKKRAPESSFLEKQDRSSSGTCKWVMDRTCINDLLQRRFVRIRKLPFIVLLLALLFVPPFFDVLKLLSTLLVSTFVCVVALVSLGLHTEKVRPEPVEMKPKRAKRSAGVSVLVVEGDLASQRHRGFLVKGSKRLRKSSNNRWSEWLRGLQGRRRSASYTEGQFINGIDEEGIKRDFHHAEGGITEIREDFRDSDSSDLSKNNKIIFLGSLDMCSPNAASKSRSARRNFASEKAAQNRSFQEQSGNHMFAHPCSEGVDVNVPELEECSSDCDKDRQAMWKPMTESTVHAVSNRSQIVPFRESHNGGERMECLRRALPQPSDMPGSGDDGLAVDKHEIFPAETLIQKCGPEDDKNGQGSHLVFMSLHKQVFDAEESSTVSDTQIFSTDYFTLEGDILWQDSDLKKPEANLEMETNGVEPVNVDYWKVSEDDGSTVGNYRNFPKSVKVELDPILNRFVKASSATQEISVLLDSFGSREELSSGTSSKIVHVAVGSRRQSVSMGDSSSSKAISDAGSDTFPATTSVIESKLPSPAKIKHSEIAAEIEEDCRAVARDLGCGTQQRGAHCRSRSTLLQSPTDLSPDTLIREQEMDLLWQEYNDYSSTQKSGKDNWEHEQRKERKQRGASVAVSRKETDNEVEVVSKDGPSEVQDNSVLEKGPWQPKARGLFKRRSFLGFCKALKDFGFKQCLQSSQVQS